jgi:hypothetical protein
LEAPAAVGTVVAASAPRVTMVMEKDAASFARYVVEPAGGSFVQVVSDFDLMNALAATGNAYGLVRVGGRVDVECYSCEEDPF